MRSSSGVCSKFFFFLHILLRLYAEKILHANLPKSSTLSAILLKEGEVGLRLRRSSLKSPELIVTPPEFPTPPSVPQLRLSSQEIYVVCSVLNTADYCQDTTRQLQDKLVELLEPELAKRVDLNEEQDAYHELISTSIAVS